MAKYLVIVESPTKAKTISKYLSTDFVVKSTVGPIRDLPMGGSTVDPREKARISAIALKLNPEERANFKKEIAREQLAKSMGFDPEQNWLASYTVLPGKQRLVKEFRELAGEFETIYLAMDMGCEGEVSAWHFRDTIGGQEDHYKRVVFGEITEKAINEAFSHPVTIDYSRVNAQQAKRFLDRIVGFMLTPLLRSKFEPGLSAGRIPLVVLRMIVEREREIQAFVPEEYWEIYSQLSKSDQAQFRFQVVSHGGKSFRPDNETDSNLFLEQLKSSDFVVKTREDSPSKSIPNPPFITSSLLKAASSQFGYRAQLTMMLAKQLYEAGYITYLHTDSTNLSADVVGACREYITSKFGSEYLNDDENVYSVKEGSLEAIRPCNVSVKSEQINGLHSDAEKIYDLIWRQFVACQMKDASYLSTSIQAVAGDFELHAKGRVIQFDGYLKVAPFSELNEYSCLSDIQAGDKLSLRNLELKQRFTNPAPRYTEASLVEALEERAIGRPSTYAAIIATIQTLGYVKLENRRFYAQKMGEIVSDQLTEFFSEIMDYELTARRDEMLDKAATGEAQWPDILTEFYSSFTSQLETAESCKGGMRSRISTDTDIPCPTCGRPMQIKSTSAGVFLGCSGSSLPPKERCKTTLNLIPSDEIMQGEDDENESRLLAKKERCGICSTAMDSYLIDDNRKLHVCGNNPNCAGFKVETGAFKITD